MYKVDLKPCPFCGGGAVFEVNQICHGHGEYHNEHFVRCRQCGARSISKSEHHLSQKDCRIIVSKYWNRRKS